jgi:hypothetical protein
MANLLFVDVDGVGKEAAVAICAGLPALLANAAPTLKQFKPLGIFKWLLGAHQGRQLQEWSDAALTRGALIFGWCSSVRASQ